MGLKATVLLLVAQATHGSGIWEKIVSGKRLSDADIEDAAQSIVSYVQAPSFKLPADFDPLPIDVGGIVTKILQSPPEALATAVPTVTPYVAKISSTAPDPIDTRNWLTPGTKYRVAVKVGKEDEPIPFDALTPVEYVRETESDYIVKENGVEYPLAKDTVDLLPPFDTQSAWGRRRRRTVRRRKTLRRKM